MTQTHIIIFGIGETAHLAYEYFTHDPHYADYEVVAFCVDAAYKQSETFLGLPVVSTEDVAAVYPPAQYKAFAAAGSGQLNRSRTKLYMTAKDVGYDCVSYISSQAFVWHNVEIGENCFVLENNTLQPFTKIGNNVTVWSGNHIGHRTVIHDNCFLTSHIVVSGFCEIGKNSFVGVNVTFADEIRVGEDCFISMATTVGKNTQDNGVYMGTPMELKKVPATRFCKVKGN